MSNDRFQFRDRSITRKIKSTHLKKLAEQKVVDLSEFRKINKKSNFHNFLVVDDEEIMCNALKKLLEREGHKVFIANDAHSLSKIIEAIKLDLILLDINLPWVNGYEICKIIKSHPKHKRVPLFFVSARSSEADIKLGYESGCDDYITKPFDVEYILEVINKTLLKSS